MFESEWNANGIKSISTAPVLWQESVDWAEA
jgi:hypothetical protein